MMKALSTAPDIDTLTFHNAGLTDASIAVLVEDLQHTSVRSLGLDYNLPPPPPPVRPSASERRLKAAELAAEAGDKAVPNEAASTISLSRPNFAGLVAEGIHMYEPLSPTVSMWATSFFSGVAGVDETICQTTSK